MNPFLVRWIDRLALAELVAATLALPCMAAAFSTRGSVTAIVAAAAVLGALLATMVFCSGVLFAADARLRAFDAKLKAGGGIEIRPAKMKRVKREPAWKIHKGELVKNLNRTPKLPRNPDPSEGPRVVGVSMKKTN